MVLQFMLLQYKNKKNVFLNLFAKKYILQLNIETKLI